jgi:hypothetical protein
MAWLPSLVVVAPTEIPPLPIGLTLVDNDGNPFPAGVHVIVSLGTTQVIDGWTRHTGTCPEIVGLTPGAVYTLTFIGRQGPNWTVNFTATTGNQIVGVSGYRSPNLNAAGFAKLQTQRLWPKGQGWWGDAARTSGGVAWALAYGIGAMLEKLGLATQQQLEAARLFSCSGNEIATWASDYLGYLLPPIIGEADTAYIQRILTWMTVVIPWVTTSTALKAVAQMYLSILKYFKSGQMMSLDTTGALDTRGSMDDPIVNSQGSSPTAAIGLDTQGALDNLGGLDVATVQFNPPTIIIFDWQDNPTLSALLPLNRDNGEFCVYFQYPNISDNSIHLMGVVPSVLQLWVNAVKAQGTLPIFATNYTS